MPPARARRLGPLAALLIGATILLGGTPEVLAGATSASPATVVGTWRSHRLAGQDRQRDREFVLTLRMLPDGTAELYTAEGDGPAFLEKGTWRLQGAEITVLVFEEGRPPDPNEMLLEARDGALVPLRWNPEFYGSSPLGRFTRQTDEEPAR